MHPDLVSAIKAINEKEKPALKRMGLYPITVIGAARTPLNPLIQICQNPGVAAGLFSSNHFDGCAADLDRRAAIEKNHNELGKILNRYGMSFISNEKTRKKDPNHIYLTSSIDPKKQQAFKQLRLKLFKGLQNAIDEADDTQNMIIDGTIVACRRGKDAIINIDDASKGLQDKISNLEKEIQNAQMRVKGKNQRYGDIVKAIAFEMAQSDKANGSIDRDRQREFFGDKDRSDKGEYWERNNRQEYHDRQRDIHCYREVRENSRGERSVERGCSGSGTREFTGGRQLP